MSYKTIQAFKHANGQLFESEDKAIEADIAEIIKDDAGYAITVRENASALLPLIQRAIVLNSAARSTAKPTEVTSGKGDGEPKKATLEELNAGRHITGCRARLTGNLEDCNCNKDSKL